MSLLGEESGFRASPDLRLQQSGVAMELSRAGPSAGWGGPSTQLVGVVGILALVSAQVVAKAESSSLVTLAG